MSSKDEPKSLESVTIFSDIGKGGKCPTCGSQNKVSNDRCIECNQKLRRNIYASGKEE